MKTVSRKKRLKHILFEIWKISLVHILRKSVWGYNFVTPYGSDLKLGMLKVGQSNNTPPICRFCKRGINP